jgi:hypothetical protein
MRWLTGWAFTMHAGWTRLRQSHDVREKLVRSSAGKNRIIPSVMGLAEQGQGQLSRDILCVRCDPVAAARPILADLSRQRLSACAGRSRSSELDVTRPLSSRLLLRPKTVKVVCLIYFSMY